MCVVSRTMRCFHSVYSTFNLVVVCIFLWSTASYYYTTVVPARDVCRTYTLVRVHVFVSSACLVKLCPAPAPLELRIYNIQHAFPPCQNMCLTAAWGALGPRGDLVLSLRLFSQYIWRHAAYVSIIYMYTAVWTENREPLSVVISIITLRRSTSYLWGICFVVKPDRVIATGCVALIIMRCVEYFKQNFVQTKHLIRK